MRFLASWWERFPKRETIPALIAFVAFSGGFSQLGMVLKLIAGPNGYVWD